jgi:hypothetical protein
MSLPAVAAIASASIRSRATTCEKYVLSGINSVNLQSFA